MEAGTRRFAQYNDLPPGSYTLTIVAANSDGVWSPRGVALPIRVEPASWQTWWFRAGAVLLALAGVGAVYRRRLSALERRRAAQDAFARQLLESQEAERKRIAGELHDGIGQTLVVIRNRALLGLQSRDGGAMAKQVEEISAAAGDGIDEVRKIAHGLRPYQLDRLGFTRAVEALVEQAASAAGLAIDAAVGPVDGAIPKGDEINVYRIVQEGVNNMIRHANARTGRVDVSLDGASVAILIEDDGVGFDPADAAARGGGLGLTGMAERARILGGTLTVRSAPGQGTTIHVLVPTAGRRPGSR